MIDFIFKITLTMMILWLGIVEMNLRNIGYFVQDSVEYSIWVSAQNPVYHSIGYSVWDSVRNSVRIPVRDSAWDYSTWSSIQDSVRSRYESR